MFCVLFYYICVAKESNNYRGRPFIPTLKHLGFLAYCFVSTVIVKFVYILGVIVFTISGLAIFFRGGIGILLGLGIIVIGNLLWRIACEGWVILFNIHDLLGSIEKNLTKRNQQDLPKDLPPS